MTKRSFSARLLRFVALLALGWVLLTIVCVALLRWVDPPTSAFILRDRLSTDYKVRHAWTDGERIASSMKVAVIAAEDQTFPEHHGFDLKSIDKALEERERGRRIRGASTISQQ